MVKLLATRAGKGRHFIPNQQVLVKQLLARVKSRLQIVGKIKPGLVINGSLANVLFDLSSRPRIQAVLDLGSISQRTLTQITTLDQLKDSGILKFTRPEYEPDRSFYSYYSRTTEISLTTAGDICSPIINHHDIQSLMGEHGEYFVIQACSALDDLLGREVTNGLFQKNPFFYAQALRLIIQMGHQSGVLDFAINYEELRDIIPPDLLQRAMETNLRDTIMAFFYIDYMSRNSRGELNFRVLFERFLPHFPAEKFAQGFVQNPIDTILAYEQVGLDPEAFEAVFSQRKLSGKLLPAAVFTFSHDDYPELKGIRIPRASTASLDDAYMLFTHRRPKESPLSIVQDTAAQMENLRDAKGAVIDIGKINYLGIRVNNARDRKNSCPQQCYYCDQEGGEHQVSIDVWKSLIDQVTENGARERIFLNISGGEPTTLRGDLIALIKHAKAHHMYVSMNSCAVTITDAYARRLVEAGLDNINISLDSHIAEENDRIVGLPGASAKVNSAIRSLNKWRNRLKSNLRISINCVITSQNYGNILDFVDTLGKRLGHAIDDINPLPIKGEQFQELELEGQEINLFLSFEEIQNFVENTIPQVVALAEKYKFRLLGRKIREIYGRSAEEWLRASQGVYYPRYDFPCYTSFVSLYAAASAQATLDGRALVRLTSCSYRVDHPELDANDGFGLIPLQPGDNLDEIRRKKLDRLNELPRGELCGRYCGPDVYRLNLLIAAELARSDRRADLLTRQHIDELAQTSGIDHRSAANMGRIIARETNIPLSVIFAEDKHKALVEKCIAKAIDFNVLPQDVYFGAKKLDFNFDHQDLEAAAKDAYEKRVSEGFMRMRLTLDTASRRWLEEESAKLLADPLELARLIREMVTHEDKDFGEIIRTSPEEIRAIARFGKEKELVFALTYRYLVACGATNIISYLKIHSDDIVANVFAMTIPDDYLTEMAETAAAVETLAQRYNMSTKLVLGILEKIAQAERFSGVPEFLRITPDPIMYSLKVVSEGFVDLLREVNQALLTTNGFGARIKIVLDGMQKITGLSSVAMTMIDEGNDQLLHVQANDEAGSNRLLNLSLPFQNIEALRRMKASGQVLVTDISILTALGLHLVEDENIKQPVLLIPMNEGQAGKTIGFITVVMAREEDLTDDVIRNAGVLAGQITSAVSLAMVQEEVEKELEREKMLAAAHRRLQGSFEQIELQLPVLARGISGLDRAALLLIDPEKGNLKGKLGPKNSSGEAREVTIPISNRTARLTPLVKAMRLAKPMLVDRVTMLAALSEEDIEEWGSWFDFQTLENLHQGFNPFVVVPLISAQHKPLGVLVLDNADLQCPCTLEQFRIVSDFARAAGFALGNALEQRKYREQSLTDELTGLFNRRFLINLFNEQVSRMLRMGESFVVALFDIDKFKRFNDLFDYKTGDLVLKVVADIMQQQARDTDRACRFGGEELLIVGSLGRAAELGDLQGMGDRVRKAVEESKIKFPYSHISTVKTLSRMYMQYEEEEGRVAQMNQGGEIFQRYGVRQIEGKDESEFWKLQAKGYARYLLVKKLTKMIKEDIAVVLQADDFEAIVDLVFILLAKEPELELKQANDLIGLLNAYGIRRLEQGIGVQLKTILEEKELENEEEDLLITLRLTVSGAVGDSKTMVRKLLPRVEQPSKDDIRRVLSLDNGMSLLSNVIHVAKEGGRNRVVVL